MDHKRDEAHAVGCVVTLTAIAAFVYCIYCFPELVAFFAKGGQP